MSGDTSAIVPAAPVRPDAPSPTRQPARSAEGGGAAPVSGASAAQPAAEAPATYIDPGAPRIAIYGDPHSVPVVVPITGYPVTQDHLADLSRILAARAHALAREQGGQIPLVVFQELMDNLVHASFAGVVVTILDGGNTLRISDSGPGIPDKEAALRPGFTSANASARQVIRGVGSGFSLVTETLAGLDGALKIEDNLGQGTVVTARVRPQADVPLAPAPVPTYNLPERQLKTLLLAVELAPVGPTRVARELGVSTSTAYRDLVLLEEAGFVSAAEAGRRTVTDAGLACLDAILQMARPGI